MGFIDAIIALAIGSFAAFFPSIVYTNNDVVSLKKRKRFRNVGFALIVFALTSILLLLLFQQSA